MKYQNLIITIRNILSRSDLTATEKYYNAKNLVFFKKELDEISETEKNTLNKYLKEWYDNALKKYSVI